MLQAGAWRGARETQVLVQRLGRTLAQGSGTEGAAYMRIEDQEDAHLYYTKGFCRELWIKSLGMNAALPPPEERENVKTAIAAAEAEKEADEERE